MAKHHVQVELMLSRQPILEGESKEITDVFHPGDLVYGRLTFTSRRAFHIMEVSNFLEGKDQNLPEQNIYNQSIIDSPQKLRGIGSAMTPQL